VTERRVTQTTPGKTGWRTVERDWWRGHVTGRGARYQVVLADTDAGFPDERSRDDGWPDGNGPRAANIQQVGRSGQALIILLLPTPNGGHLAPQPIRKHSPILRRAGWFSNYNKSGVRLLVAWRGRAEVAPTEARSGDGRAGIGVASLPRLGAKSPPLFSLVDARSGRPPSKPHHARSTTRPCGPAVVELRQPRPRALWLRWTASPRYGRGELPPHRLLGQQLEDSNKVAPAPRPLTARRVRAPSAAHRSTTLWRAAISRTGDVWVKTHALSRVTLTTVLSRLSVLA